MGVSPYRDRVLPGQRAAPCAVGYGVLRNPLPEHVAPEGNRELVAVAAALLLVLTALEAQLHRALDVVGLDVIHVQVLAAPIAELLGLVVPRADEPRGRQHVAD